MNPLLVFLDDFRLSKVSYSSPTEADSSRSNSRFDHLPFNQENLREMIQIFMANLAHSSLF